MIESKRPSLVKPSTSTPYHIDFDWWENNDRNWRVYLRSYLCSEHQKIYKELSDNDMIDWVDPDTAEVQQVDGVQHALISHCVKQPEFITDHTTLIDAVFRLFLANGNAPMNCLELGEKLGKSAQVILTTISGVRVYKGIRPILIK